MNAVYIGANQNTSFSSGNEYQVLSKSSGLFRIIDDSGEDYLYELIDNEWDFKGGVLEEEIMEKELLIDTTSEALINQLLEDYQSRNLGNNNNQVLFFRQVAATTQKKKNEFHVQQNIMIPQSNYHIPSGSIVTGVIITHRGNEIRDIARLMSTYGKENTKIDDWKKMRGTVFIFNGSEKKKAEIHWYQCKNVGKLEFKIKKFFVE